MVGLDVPNQVGAGAVGHPHIGETQIELFIGEALTGALNVLRRIRLHPHSGQGDFDQLANVDLVVDHQYAGCTHG